MRRVVLPALVAVVVSGCGMAQAVRDKEVEMSREKCAAYGIAAGSPQMAQCVMENAQAMEAQRARNFQAGQAANARLGTSGVGTGVTMIEPAPAIVIEHNTSRTTSTTNVINMSPPPTLHCTQSANAGVCTSN